VILDGVIEEVRRRFVAGDAAEAIVDAVAGLLMKERGWVKWRARAWVENCLGNMAKGK
jgi:hypothetical protein